MPIYEFECEECKGIVEKIQSFESDVPVCCGSTMSRLPTFPVMVKVMGEGGYPSRRKFMKGSAPGATRDTHPWLSYDPSDTSINQIGQKVKTQE